MVVCQAEQHSNLLIIYWENNKYKKLIYRAIERKMGNRHENVYFPLFVRARPCFGHGVFRVPKNGEPETNKPLAMRVVENALAYSKKPPVL